MVEFISEIMKCTSLKSKSLRVIATLVLAMIFFGASEFSQTEVWKAPASADNIKNPYKNNSAMTEKGKILYNQMCAVCHGETGRGDGPAGINLNPRPADHAGKLVQEQSDGAIYWKISEGRVPMAAYGYILSEEQRWQLVNYIRTLKKQ